MERVIISDRCGFAPGSHNSLSAKLSEDEAKEVILHCHDSATDREFAAKFGVHPYTIYQIRRCKRWVWLWDKMEQAGEIGNDDA